MTQIIDIPTRFSQKCASLIVLIYVCKIDDVMAHGTINGPADHGLRIGLDNCNRIETIKYLMKPILNI